MTRVRTITRGLASLLALVAIVVGLPVLLARWGHMPGAPNRQWWAHLGDHAVSDTAVFAVLTIAAWIVWAGFVATVAVELMAGVRGVQAPRIAIAGPLQQSARTLVAAVFVMLSLVHAPATYASSSSPADNLPSRVAAAVALATRAPEPERLDPAPLDKTARPPAHNPSVPTSETDAVSETVVVERGDNPWRIAERYLGDGMRWRELFDVNRGVPQPDGRAWFDPEVILPGWKLRIPTNPPAPPVVASPASATIVHVVVHGDTLSELAERYLGDAGRYPELFDANRDIVQPDGRRLTDPRLIVVGWKLIIPATVAPASAPPVMAPASTQPSPAVW
jgi:nucleoid-associated protein YgaU